MILHAKSQKKSRLRRGFPKTLNTEVLTKGKGLQICQNRLPKFGTFLLDSICPPPCLSVRLTRGGHIDWNTTDVFGGWSPTIFQRVRPRLVGISAPPAGHQKCIRIPL